MFCPHCWWSWLGWQFVSTNLFDAGEEPCGWKTPGTQHYYGKGLLLNINKSILSHWTRTAQRQHELLNSRNPALRYWKITNQCQYDLINIKHSMSVESRLNLHEDRLRQNLIIYVVKTEHYFKHTYYSICFFFLTWTVCKLLNCLLSEFIRIYILFNFILVYLL